MIALTDADLYVRGAETLLAAWEEYARGASGAAVQRYTGVATAVFPNEPERGVYNNAVLERDLEAAARSDAITTMEAAYAAAGVTRFAAWVHESDPAMCGDLERRGYTLDTSTRAMGMALEDICMARPELHLGALEWSEYLRIFGLPPGLLAGGQSRRLPPPGRTRRWRRTSRCRSRWPGRSANRPGCRAGAGGRPGAGRASSRTGCPACRPARAGRPSSAGPAGTCPASRPGQSRRR